MDALFTGENLVAFLTLTGLELVLGIDNVVFISILAGKLPPERRSRARRVGLGLAMFARIGLLLGISWVVGLTTPWFSLIGRAFSGRDVVLLLGGLFLVAKATLEIHDKLEGEPHRPDPARDAKAVRGILLQIVLVDIVFSLDSVITAVGMARAIPVMVAAVVVSVLAMMAFAGAISAFIERHPTMKMLALSFLLMIGVVLIVDGFGGHVGKGYVYAAMAFSLFVEFLNLKARGRAEPVQLRARYEEGGARPS
jgi:predicted tellurium resistance membrane protein TerC